MNFEVLQFENTPERQKDVERLVDLFRKNWNESQAAKHGAFRPDLDSFMQAWSKGGMVVVGYRVGDQLEGYQIWQVSAHMMIPDLKTGLLIAVFLEPDKRGKTLWPEFEKFGRMVMSAHGIKRTGMVCDAGSKMHSYAKKKGLAETSVMMIYG